MKCDELKNIQGMYIDGMLDAAARSRVEEHLAGCAGCRGQLARAVSAAGLLRHLPEKPMPRAVHDGIMRAVRHVPCVPVRSGWLAVLERFMMPAVSFAMVLAAVIYVADNRMVLSPVPSVQPSAIQNAAPQPRPGLFADMAAIESAVRVSSVRRAALPAAGFRGAGKVTFADVPLDFDQIVLKDMELTAELRSLMQRRAQRWPELEPFISQAALGEDNRGMLRERKPEMFTAADRALVAAENRDRAQLCALAGPGAENAAAFARACRQASPRGAAVQAEDGRWLSRE